MKKIGTITILIAGIFLLNGCEGDFLDRKEPAVITLDNFYLDAEDAEMAINSCYSPMQWPYFVSPMMLGDMMSEDAVKGSTYGDNSLQWNEMIFFQGVASATVVEWKWRTIFKVIFKSNLALEHVPGIDMDETRRDQILGEAYFLRAFSYFECVISWGGVPVITEPLEDYYIPKNTAEEVWAQVESDLEQAIELLPEKSEWASDQIGRATRGAALAMLGKAYLYQHKYAEAEGIFADLVQSPEYTLNPDFGEVFTLEGENGMGSILELQFVELGEDDIYEAEGNFIVTFQGPRDINGGWGFNQGSFELLNEFGYYAVDAETLDKITNYGMTGTDWFSLSNKISALSGNQYLSYEEFETALKGVLSEVELSNHAYMIYRSAFKPTDPRFEHTFVFLDETVDDVYVDPNLATDHYTGMYNRKAFMHIPDIWRLAPINERLIRLSDVYLMYAEAAAQNGNTGPAKTYLNLVRQRAASAGIMPLADFPNYSDGYGTAYQDTEDDLLRAIYNERRLELAFEHFRFFDLVRTGQAEDVLGEFGYVEGVHNVFPIPQGDIDRSGGVLVQNTGY